MSNELSRIALLVALAAVFRYRADLWHRHQREIRNEERVALAVYDGFCTVLLREADAETARDALAYYENYAKDLGKRFELGLARKLDYSRALQQRESASAEYTGAKNALSTARIGLFTLLRIPPDASVDIVGDLETAPVAVLVTTIWMPGSP